MEGDYPRKAQALVREFIKKYQRELQEMWDKEEYIKLPPLQ